MKKLLIGALVIVAFGLTACENANNTAEKVSRCFNTPLAEGCFNPSEELNHVSPIPEEYTITETFETDRVNQTPRNWLIYTNAEYDPNGVSARVIEEGGQRFVRMYSDGKQRPPYPLAAPVPTFIFSSKFNLDIDRKGIAYADVMVPATERNAVTVSLSTGAVNAISVTIDRNLALTAKVGGPFFYHSGNNDSGLTTDTLRTLTADTWYRFKFTFDAHLDEVSVSILDGETYTLLHTSPFHVSNRFNAVETGMILVPNSVKVTMPRNQAGYAYLDNVIVERKGA